MQFKKLEKLVKKKLKYLIFIKKILQILMIYFNPLIENGRNSAWCSTIIINKVIEKIKI